MDAEPPYRLPRWAPRVSKTKIERMYRDSAHGLLDDCLVDEVGYALYARCESMLEVTEITRSSRPKCPVCATILSRRTFVPDEIHRCLSCGWECPARAYNKTYSRKNLGTGGLDDRIRGFLHGFRAARSAGEKLVLIDTLIHLFHWSSSQGRPLATALIEGRMKTTVAFLDRLSYGDSVPDEARRTRAEWRRIWSGNGWGHGRGQGEKNPRSGNSGGKPKGGNGKL